LSWFKARGAFAARRRTTFFEADRSMANKITIPKLGSKIAELGKLEYQKPYNTVAPFADAFLTLADAIKARNDADEGARDAADAGDQHRRAPGSSDDDAPEPPHSSESDRDPSARGRRAYPAYVFDDQLRRLADERRRQRRAYIGEAMDDLADAAFKDPSRIGDYRDEADGLSGIVGDDDAEDLAAARERMNEQYFRGLIRDNPKAALEMLRSRAGYAQEDLGISEEAREDLETAAQRAFDTEQNLPHINAQVKMLDTRAGLRVYGVKPGMKPREMWRGYHDIIDAYDWDAKSAERLEPEFDKTVREAQTYAKAIAMTAHDILRGRATRWDRIERADAVDAFVKAVVGESVWTTPARHRMAWISRAASHTPNVVRESIRSGVYARDAGKRAFAGRMLMDLEDAGDPAHGLLEWAPPDIRAFGHDFGALTHAGFSDDAAVKRIEAAASLTPEQQESRRHAFDVRLDGAAFWDTLREAVDIEPRDLLYRPERDKIVEDRGPYVDDGRAKASELDYGSPYGGIIPGGVTPGPSGRRDARLYDDADLQTVRDYRQPILDVAQKLGVSETAIGGCIAEELDDARRRGLLEDGQSFFKWLILSRKTHKDIAADYDAWEQELARNPLAGDPQTGFGVIADMVTTGITKARYPATLDIGHGKIRLHTAIRMLREYNQRYPNSDPLGLKKYNNAYDVLAHDLGSARAPATAAFAGLMVEEATRWFESKIPDAWGRMAIEDRDALIVEYYNQGRERIRARYDEDMKRDGYYSPEPGESGKRHRVNAGFIRQQMHPL
jgi:DnaJ-domain-containing protein 1